MLVDFQIFSFPVLISHFIFRFCNSQLCCNLKGYQYHSSYQWDLTNDNAYFVRIHCYWLHTLNTLIKITYKQSEVIYTLYLNISSLLTPLLLHLTDSLNRTFKIHLVMSTFHEPPPSCCKRSLWMILIGIYLLNFVEIHWIVLFIGLDYHYFINAVT